LNPKKIILFTLSLLLIGLSFATANPKIPLKTGSPDEIIESINKVVEKKDKSREVAQSPALESPDSSIRIKEHAAWALGELELRKQVRVLVKATENKSLLVRSAALNSLIHLRARTGLPAYKKIANNDPILLLRKRGVVAMGVLRWEKTIDTLVALSSDERIEIRGASLLAMGATHSKKNDFRKLLKEMKKDKDIYVQERAQKGLDVALRRNEAVHAHLKSDDPAIRLFAAVYFHYHGRSKDLAVLKDARQVESDEEVRYSLWLAQEGIRKRIARAKARRKAAAKKKAAEAKKTESK